MDFSLDGMGRQPAPGPNTNRFAPAGGPAPVVQEGKPKKAHHEHGRGGGRLWARVGLTIFLLCMVALVVAVLLFIGNNKPANEGKYVNTSEFQAVEVSTGQTPTYYYGNITDISNGYLVLSNPLVLTSDPSSQTVTVATLNCVSPSAGNQLVINLSRVIAWNNLAASSPAGQAIHVEQTTQSGSCPSPTSSSTSSQSMPNMNMPASSSSSTSQTPATSTNSSTAKTTTTTSTTPSSTTTKTP